jgi:hypothetical protein
MIKKAKSYLGKAINIDLEAMRESEFNISFPNQKTESIAKKRADICKGCKHNELEPIDSERVIDELIPELSNRMCGKCFCPLPKLLRQNKKKCKAKKWK